MLFVENLNTIPYRNHALEEWLMQKFNEDCFMLWRNDKAILLGKNQNLYKEVNLPYASEKGIKLVRRLSGGGTVFTDGGNIMFSFISCNNRQDFADFHKFTEPILKALQKLGIPAEFSGRNDLTIQGKKFSGNAQCRYRDKVLHHGTLMYKANTDELMKALKVSDLKLKSKGVASVKSRVTNISSHMTHPMDIEEFRRYLFESVMSETKDAKMYRLSESDWAEVKELEQARHAKEAWIYGKNPKFNLEKESKLPGGIVQVCLEVHKGKIEKAGIYGDFFSSMDISEIEEALVGVLYKKDHLEKVLQTFEIDNYFKNITVEELLTALI